MNAVIKKNLIYKRKKKVYIYIYNPVVLEEEQIWNLMQNAILKSFFLIWFLAQTRLIQKVEQDLEIIVHLTTNPFTISDLRVESYIIYSSIHYKT